MRYSACKHQRTSIIMTTACLIVLLVTCVVLALMAMTEGRRIMESINPLESVAEFCPCMYPWCCHAR
ncbi:hypothetical protein DPMN_136384 [Dreissena polymorpha]|uniref:Uncharacterized protein n=1 Tax=Dreissena polymorpha TaxID=45954 RepID=A0A9D4G0R7_DREPO|nr:hypothetical protein DPMN_136384 [Dreissena polymorpha]